jgi:hypothetical protein
LILIPACPEGQHSPEGEAPSFSLISTSVLVEIPGFTNKAASRHKSLLTDDRHPVLRRKTLPTMSSSILRDIAELSNPNPEDFDPEDIARDYESSDDDSAEDVDAGREHYVDVR